MHLYTRTACVIKINFSLYYFSGINYNSFHKLRWNRKHERTSTHKAQALYLKVRDRQQIVHTDYKAKEKGTGLFSMEALLPYN